MDNRTIATTVITRFLCEAARRSIVRVVNRMASFIGFEDDEFMGFSGFVSNLKFVPYYNLCSCSDYNVKPCCSFNQFSIFQDALYFNYLEKA